VNPSPATPTRLMSLDALRGFDMFWIVGADAIVEGLQKVSNNGVLRGLSNQLEHVQWAGFHFEDLIFPMFVFMVGVSLVFSLGRIVQQKGRAPAVGRIIRRAIPLYLLGVFYYGGFSTPFAEIRLLGVLQRIAIAYLFAGLIFVFFEQRGRIAWCVGLLVGYWALMTFVPVPGGAAGDFTAGHNLANWIDKHYLPLRKWDGDYDPEGLLSTLPAIASCLLGVFAGVMLGNGKLSPWRKVAILAGAGIALVACGWLWNLQFPVIKKLWTSSFVLVAGGYSSLFLAGFYLIIDIWGWRRWAAPFVWIGMNPIAVYMLHNLVDLEKIAKRIVGGDLNRYFASYGQLVVAAVVVLITFGFARFLYQRKIFLRL
jgi:predicted acyltransferase